jgi:glutamate/tyrosine decarboxylase-like PLP-dependent enzyme
VRIENPMMTKSTLSSDAENFAALLEETLEAASDYLDTIAERPPASEYQAQDLMNLPENGLGGRRTLELFLGRYGKQMPASNGPRFWGFVTGGTTPAAVMGDWLASVYDLNLSSAANSNAPDIEREAIGFLRDLFGLPGDFEGVFVSGATMANFTALAMAREWVGRQAGISVAQAGLHAIGPVRVIGGTVHSSVLKSLAMLGMGRDCLIPVAELSGNREAVDIAALEDALTRLDGSPCIVIANAGTVNTVDFDDIRPMAALKRRHPFWLHVDAAFGGFAACSPLYRERLAGLELADSITIDAHKWLNVPYDSAMVFTRWRDLQSAVFQNSAAYLGPLTEPVDFLHLTPENSRRMRALPAWFTLLAYGKEGYRQIVETQCEMARILGQKIEQSEPLRLLAPVRMNVVCFTLSGDADQERVRGFLTKIRQDGKVFLTPTTYHGQAGLRAAFSNWRTDAADVDIAWEALRRCW